MIFLIDLAIALPLFDETQNKTSVCMFSGFLGRSKCCLVELEIKRHRLHFKKAWCAQDRICETHIFLNRWVVLFNQIDDSLSPRTSNPLGLSRFKTDLFCPRVYKRNGVLIVWSLEQIKDGLILWLLWCMCMWMHTYICSRTMFKRVR